MCERVCVFEREGERTPCRSRGRLWTRQREKARTHLGNLWPRHQRKKEKEKERERGREKVQDANMQHQLRAVYPLTVTTHCLCCEAVDPKTVTSCESACAEHTGRCSRNCLFVRALVTAIAFAQHELTATINAVLVVETRRARERESKRA